MGFASFELRKNWFRYENKSKNII